MHHSTKRFKCSSRSYRVTDICGVMLCH